MTKNILVGLIIVVIVGFAIVGGWMLLKTKSKSGSSKIEQPLAFLDVTNSSNIRFTHFDSPRHSLLPEDVGSGAAWGDFDNDGDQDVYLVNFAGRILTDQGELQKRSGNKLYQNNGNGTFTDVTHSSGIGHVGWDNGCLWFDYDNDGWLDLAVTHVNGIILFRNLGNGTFQNMTIAAGLETINKYLLGIAASDYDQDGDVDLYVCGYVHFDRSAALKRPLVAGRPANWTNPVPFAAESNLLLRNNGNGTFSDLTDYAGVANSKGKSMQALFCDLNNDELPDLYVCNDVGTADALYRNKGDGTFVDDSRLAGTHDRRAGMGIAVGDLWKRGSMDLFVTHWVKEDHALWKNVSSDLDGIIGFDDVGPQVGLAPKPPDYVGWGTGLYDFNNDCSLDLMIVNGSTIEDELTLDVLKNPKLVPQPPQLFWNDGQNNFVDVSNDAGEFFYGHRVSRGCAFADFDGDGLIDALVMNHGDAPSLLRNVSKPTGNWLKVKVIGRRTNKFGIGAKVTIKAGNFTQTRQIVCGSSYLSGDTLLAHFGLGNAVTVENLTVRFPSGITATLQDVAVNQKFEVIEPVIKDEQSG